MSLTSGCAAFRRAEAAEEEGREEGRHSAFGRLRDRFGGAGGTVRRGMDRPRKAQCVAAWSTQVLKAESGTRGNCARRGESVRAARTASAFPSRWRLPTQRAENFSIR